jgi:hypothetical protein
LVLVAQVHHLTPLQVLMAVIQYFQQLLLRVVGAVVVGMVLRQTQVALVVVAMLLTHHLHNQVRLVQQTKALPVELLQFMTVMVGAVVAVVQVQLAKLVDLQIKVWVVRVLQ